MSPPKISFTDGAFLKCATEAIAYGISVVLSLRAIELLFRRPQGSINKVMLYGAIALLLLSTMHIVAVIQYLRQGLIQSPSPTSYFDLITTPVKVVEQSARIITVSLADTLTVWRLWGVWNWNLGVVIVPCITLIGTVVCAAGFVTDQNLIKQRPGASIFTSSVLDWTVAFLACSLATTWYSTALITYKLVKADSIQDRTPLASIQRRWRKLLRILIESAALYSGTNLVYMVLYLEQTNAEAMLSAWEVPVASITFSLIIIRVHNLSSQSGDMSTAPYNVGTLSTVSVVNQPTTMFSKPTIISQYHSHIDDSSV